MEDTHESPLKIIDAFVDGERVDGDALKSALADPDGRDYLVDVWLMREAFQADPSRDQKAAAPVVANTRRAPWWLVAAAIAAALVGGYAAGQSFGRNAPVTGPMTTGAPVAATPATSPADGPFPVPVPTRVIQLEFRSTSASSGGN